MDLHRMRRTIKKSSIVVLHVIGAVLGSFGIVQAYTHDSELVLAMIAGNVGVYSILSVLGIGYVATAHSVLLANRVAYLLSAVILVGVMARTGVRRIESFLRWLFGE